MQPRYQIFISSTFKDLEKEREAVLKAVLELQHFPSGMELFTASNSAPWEVIEKLIEESDYYVLVIGGKYGSMDEEGISFTEREYDLAVKLGKHVLAFPHAEPENLPLAKSETEPAIRDKLERFKAKVRKHLLKAYRTPEDLRGHVLASLAIAFQKKPQVGWVKAGGRDNKELLEKIVSLQEENAALKEENKALRTAASDWEEVSGLSRGEEEFEIKFTFSVGDTSQHLGLIYTWDSVFEFLAPVLMEPATSEYLSNIYEAMVLQDFRETDDYVAKVPDQEEVHLLVPDINTVLWQFLGLGLVDKTHSEQPATKMLATVMIEGGVKTRWFLTAKGQRKFLQKYAIQSKASKGVIPVMATNHPHPV